MGTKANEVIEYFESSFIDDKEIPLDLELMWLKKSIAKYCIELNDISYNDITNEFKDSLDNKAILVLAGYMRQLYQEREYSRVNKIVSIVGKDISINGNNSLSQNSKNELQHFTNQVDELIDNLKPPAYG